MRRLGPGLRPEGASGPPRNGRRGSPGQVVEEKWPVEPWQRLHRIDCLLPQAEQLEERPWFFAADLGESDQHRSSDSQCGDQRVRACIAMATGLASFRAPGELDVIIFSAAISACEKSGRWLNALGLLKSMRRRRLLPNEVTMGAVVAACEKAGEWKSAVRLLAAARESGLKASLLTFSSALSAMEKSAQWRRATALVQGAKHLQLDVVAFSAELSCNEKADQWQRSFNILDRMSARGVSPSIITLNAAVSSCESTGQWQRAINLLGARRFNLSSDVVSFSAAVSSSGASGKWTTALGLAWDMRTAAVRANVITCNSLVSACEESGLWERALEIFQSPKSFTNIVGINAGIAAGGRGSLWRFATFLLGSLVVSDVPPTLVSFNSALSACVSCKQWREVLGVTDELTRCELRPDAISLNSVATALERQGHWAGASQFLFEAQQCGERLLGPEVSTMGVAVQSSERFGGMARAAGLLGSIQTDAPRNLREIGQGRVSRSLPDKNELANACYFTYKVGYVICDPSLGPEAAQREMEAGRCNQDFRLTGSDFQRLALKHYFEGSRPPLEEAMWLLTSSENFQSRTLSECPPMQILANVLYAEALLFLDGASRTGESALLMAQAQQQLRQVRPEVLNALAQTWPLELAQRRFQETFLTAVAVAKATPPAEVQLVICRCTEELDWLLPLVADISDTAIHLYETCETSDDFSELEAKLIGNFVRTRVDESGANSNCPAQTLLRHLMRYGDSSLSLPKFLLFLPSSPSESEEHFYNLVLKSISSRTLSVDFMSLGSSRSRPISLSACQKSLIQAGVLDIQNYPLGYEGPRFLISTARLLESLPRLLSLLQAFQEPPAGCNPEQLETAVADWWHIVFGEQEQLPIRADDRRLPIFARSNTDGPSGFSRTRMPKSSDYLSWAAIGLDS